MVAVTETWFWPREDDGNLMARDYSFLKWIERMGE